MKALAWFLTLGASLAFSSAAIAQARPPSQQSGPIKVYGRVTTDGVTSQNKALVTTETTPSGSLAQGPVFVETTRSGGFGQYGNGLFSYKINAPTPLGQFDVGLTSWVSQTNLTGGQVFGGWWGANTPSSGKDYNGVQLNQTYTGGAAIGGEINVGNRWADFGLQRTPGARYTTGLQIVPDILPASDGPTTAIYPGTYGIGIGQSVHGHKWWTGEYIGYDGIMPGGLAHLTLGGSVAEKAPLSAHEIGGYWQNGIDFSGGSYSNAAMKFADQQKITIPNNGTLILDGNLSMTGRAWAPYTPALTSGTNTLGSTTALAGFYTKIGKTVIGQASATITTNGTGSGSLSLTLPPDQPALGNATVTLFEDAVTGSPAFGLIYSGTTSISGIRKADGTYPGGDGRRFTASFTYQTP